MSKAKSGRGVGSASQRRRRSGGGWDPTLIRFTVFCLGGLLLVGGVIYWLFSSGEKGVPPEPSVSFREALRIRELKISEAKEKFAVPAVNDYVSGLWELDARQMAYASEWATYQDVVRNTPAIPGVPPPPPQTPQIPTADYSRLKVAWSQKRKEYGGAKRKFDLERERIQREFVKEHSKMVDRRDGEIEIPDEDPPTKYDPDIAKAAFYDQHHDEILGGFDWWLGSNDPNRTALTIVLERLKNGESAIPRSGRGERGLGDGDIRPPDERSR